MRNNSLKTQCCIVGGGPAGIMLGFLLARAGIKTLVLEKWPDFFRDFRGDTIHPSTMEILNELNLLDDFLKLPHSKTYQLGGEIDGHHVTLANFSHLKVKCPFIAFLPQWDFLNFIASKAKQYPNFELRMQTEAINIIQDQDKIIGVMAKNPDGTVFDIHADLVVAADGRHSTVREKSGLTTQSLSAPMDVLWFRVSRHAADPAESLGKIKNGRILVMLDRGDYWQCGYIIRKGSLDTIHQRGIAAFQQSIVDTAPNLASRVYEITNWDQVKLLVVTVDRLKTWYRPGLLCIGDAAHAMSPIGGVGINLAIQDAVASANQLIPAFLHGTLSENTLKAIQKRRELPTRIIQAIQIFIQNHAIDRILENQTQARMPKLFRLLQRFPYLQRLTAYIVGMGFRREHIQS